MTLSLAVLPSEGATTAGSYFVATYPPFAAWRADALDAVQAALHRAPAPATPLGLYVHIPFCRKRCHFCYFKVYTEQNAQDVTAYIDALAREAALYAPLPFLGGRKPRFVYFGGGTPSYLSAEQMQGLHDALQRALPWDGAEEVTFECEPGTVNLAKLRALKAMGVTRLSIGIENFDDQILEVNGRAHRSKHAFEIYELAREVGLPQINVDLIAGMVGESDENWRACVEKTLALQPDSVTIYQLEVPWNTTLAHEMKALGRAEAPVATWAQKRAWVGLAFAEMERAGYRVSSAYTVVKGGGSFVYRDRLWAGADLLPLGVSSFGHVSGAHLQNEKDIDLYMARVQNGELPLQRGLVLGPDELLVREAILQLKLGRLSRRYFQDKFGVDIYARFAGPLGALAGAGLAELGPETLTLSREALLRVDALLPSFYAREYR